MRGEKWLRVAPQAAPIVAGETGTITVAAHGFNNGDVVGCTEAGTFEKAVTGKYYPMLGLVRGKTTNTFRLLMEGEADLPGATVGAVYRINDGANAGALTLDLGTGFSDPVAVGTSEDVIWFNGGRNAVSQRYRIYAPSHSFSVGNTVSTHTTGPQKPTMAGSLSSDRRPPYGVVVSTKTNSFIVCTNGLAPEVNLSSLSGEIYCDPLTAGGLTDQSDANFNVMPRYRVGSKVGTFLFVSLHGESNVSHHVITVSNSSTTGTATIAAIDPNFIDVRFDIIGWKNDNQVFTTGGTSQNLTQCIGFAEFISGRSGIWSSLSSYLVTNSRTDSGGDTLTIFGTASVNPQGGTTTALGASASRIAGFAGSGAPIGSPSDYVTVTYTQATGVITVDSSDESVNHTYRVGITVRYHPFMLG